MTARVLAEAEDMPLFATDPTGGFVRREGFSAIDTSANRHRVRAATSGYIAIPSLDASFSSVGYYRPERIQHHVDEDLAIIRQVRPDVVVTHMQPTAVIAARIEGLPIVSIADGDFLRAGPCSWMPWVPAHAVSRLTPFPSSCAAFNTVLAKAGLPEIFDVADLMRTEAVLIGGTPEVEPVDGRTATGAPIDFVGPLIWDPGEAEVARKLNSFETRARPRIYVTGGSGELASRQMASAAIEIAAQNDWAVFYAAGYKAEQGAGSHACVMSHPFGGIRPALEWCDVVVCHGGHSTVMGALAAGKPMVVIPTMSETEGNGRFMAADHGAGMLLCSSTWDEGQARLKIVSRYPDEADLISPRTLSRAVQEILESTSYAKAASSLSQRMAPWIKRSSITILEAFERLSSRV